MLYPPYQQLSEMEALNNLHLPSTTKKNFGSSQEWQERLLAELSEPLQSRARPRNPLSKFTITSPSSNPSSCENAIPAYRTFARERLPILSPKDKQKLNISPVSGMPYYISSHVNIAGDQVRSNSSTDDMKTRRCLLQKKTIHHSLQDLRNISGKRNHPFDALHSPRSRKSIPSSSWDFSSQRYTRRSEDYKEKRNGNLKHVQTASPVPVSLQCQQTKQNTQVHTDNIVNTTRNESRNSISQGCGPGGDCIVSVSNQTNEEDVERNFRNLSIENELLKKRIKEDRKKCAFYRIVNAFTFEALRRRSHLLAQLEQSVQQRKVECAARVILHHLLLNSWRMTKGQVIAISAENAQMHKTIDNQSLQLNVIRKMQSIEKEKTSSALKDYNEVKRNYCQTIKENESMKEEFAKVLEEKRSLERHLRSLSDENSQLNTELQVKLDKKEMQLRSMELDRFRAETFSRENEQLEKETESARMQIKELTTQRAHWQKKAMSYESKCYELKQEMESKEKAYEQVLYEKRDVSKENEILILSKTKLEKDVEDTLVKLVKSTGQNEKLEKAHNECKEELENLENQVEYLQTALKQYKKENDEIRQKLYDCTLKNVKRRRVWGAALYYIVNPIEAFKRLYFGPSEEIQSGRIVRLPAGS